MRFLQISDVHLGAPLTASALGLSGRKRVQRQQELQEALATACALAQDEGAEVILLPGDLFDHESVTRETLFQAADTLRACGLPIVLSPGNHDFYAASSFYNPGFLHDTHGLNWPEKLHVLSNPGWSRLQLPELPGVAFTGMPYMHHHRADERPLEQLPPPLAGVQNVLLFHGSRIDYEPPGKQKVLPFSDRELERVGYDYVALGHYHSHSEIRASNGRLLGAYSGCPAGRGLDECGDKGVLVGEIDERGAVELTFHAVDSRRILDLTVDCTGAAEPVAVLERIEERVRAVACRPADIVYARLTGRCNAALDLLLPPDFLAGRCFHLRVDISKAAPDYDLAQYGAGPTAETTEGHFVAAIRRRLANAADTQERETLERALYYGLDALIAGTVTPRYEAAEVE